MRERHRLARPFPPRLVRARDLGVIVARAARKRNLQPRSALQAAGVAVRVREHRARDRLVAREAAREEVRAVRMAVVGGLPEGEDDDASDAALRGAAALSAKHRAAHRVLVERDRGTRPQPGAVGGSAVRGPAYRHRLWGHGGGHEGVTARGRQPRRDGSGGDQRDGDGRGQECRPLENAVSTTFTQH